MEQLGTNNGATHGAVLQIQVSALSRLTWCMLGGGELKIWAAPEKLHCEGAPRARSRKPSLAAMLRSDETEENSHTLPWNCSSSAGGAAISDTRSHVLRWMLACGGSRALGSAPSPNSWKAIKG